MRRNKEISVLGKKSVAIDCLNESTHQYGEGCAVVVVDVIRSITVAATIVESGRRCFFAASVESAILLAKQFDNPLLVGEMGGSMPYGFDITNSPVEIEKRKDISRPAILLSSSGIPLLCSLRGSNSVYVACLRNYGATVKHLAEHYNRVVVLGAPTRGEFREEDQLCCAWIAAGMIKDGYTSEDEKTGKIVNRWMNELATVCGEGKSAEYLRRSGQIRDLDYILRHLNDLKTPLSIKKDEIVKTPI
jgi:2-phosphosulfolactate phosphatase